MFTHLLNIDRYDEACEWAASMTFARFPAAPKNSEPVYRESIKNIRAKAKEDFQKKVSGGLLMLSAQEQERVMPRGFSADAVSFRSGAAVDCAFR